MFVIIFFSSDYRCSLTFLFYRKMNSITCEMPSSPTTSTVNVRVVSSSGDQISYQRSFSYKVNPFLNTITPMKSIVRYFIIYYYINSNSNNVLVLLFVDLKCMAMGESLHDFKWPGVSTHTLVWLGDSTHTL